jgi:crotonobetainyl-CoA:carnitine CoA-transferase CaiB-like acyl-CoA transferase
MFNTSDKPIVIAVGSDIQWTATARALGLADLADDPSLSTNAGRLAQRERIVSKFTQQLAMRPAAHWRDALDRAGVPNGVVFTVLEALAGANGSALTGMPSSVGGAARFEPPALDEHGLLIRNAGWSAFSAASSLAETKRGT